DDDDVAVHFQSDDRDSVDRKTVDQVLNEALRLERRREVRAEQERAAADAGGAKETAASGLEAAHDRCSPAAFLIASRIRGYVPQRQMLPRMASSISLSVSCLFSFFTSSSSAAALMIWPGWQ